MKHTFKKRLLSLAVVSALGSSISISASAQEAVADETEIIEVKGFRASLIKARDLKRDAIGSQDSIVAEDIADFPDLNLADSLQRIPGISITREGGEGRNISLRGMGPDFTRVQLNGMEVLGNSSSALDSRGSISRSRAFDFNIFASELFNQIDVRKSFSAELDEGGIGGTVNLRTAKPFDYDGFKGAVTGNIGTNSNTDSTDPRVAALISNTWGNFGALFSVAYNKRESAEVGVDTFRWRQRTRSNFDDDGNLLPEEDRQYNEALPQDVKDNLEEGNIWFARGNRYSSWNNEQERLGITSAFQFRPTDDLSFDLDILYGELNHDRVEYHLDTSGSSSTALGYIESLTVVDNNGDLEAVNGTFTDVTLRTETRKDKASTEFQQIALSSDWIATNNLTVRGLIGYEKSEFKQPQRDKVYFETTGGITTDYETNRFYADFDYDFDPADINNWTVRELDFQEDESVTEFANAEVNFEYGLDNGDEIRFGVSVKSFENSGFRFQANDLVKDVGAPAFGSQQGDAPNVIQPDGYSIFNHPNASWVAADVDAVQAYYGVVDWDITDPSVAAFYASSSNPGEYQTRPQNRFGIKEDTLAFYAQYMFEIESLNIRGSVGARYYDTDIESSGVTNDTEEPFTAKQDYDGVLPTLNLTGDINDDSLWRVSISKNITRPSLSSLSVTAPQIQNDPDGSAGLRVSSGNPSLEPFESLNIDTSYEYYIGDT
ncbi:MAG: TonB-dependent receptor, partial [Paraglaciecola sp.]|uniref:TonB-dependent receptor n=1 Tax=Paraglaciecola sp. TaxID=1920173 RepID=UPI003298378A